MKPTFIYFSILLGLFLTFSCSEDAKEDEEILDSVDLLVGSWNFESEHNYDCATNEILIERFSDIEDDEDYPGDITYNADGTFIERDGLEEDGGGNYEGTWERISETTYRFNYETPESYTYDVEIGKGIIFESDDIHLSNITDCDENQSDYDAVRWVRLK